MAHRSAPLSLPIRRGVRLSYAGNQDAAGLRLQKSAECAPVWYSSLVVAAGQGVYSLTRPVLLWL